MATELTQDIARRAKAIYESKWRKQLEDDHRDKYIAIEPDAGEFFLGDSFGEAVQNARRVYPDRITFVIRVGHEAAIHMGAMSM
ncbi:MAG: hypothetical protein O2955_01535 [Planctomycetota bacterium]|nr:hypothetical protein [Planctomycetota bacterium]MDA1211165.1 hypothetical protein [Planctomycetota bacterium]